MLSYVPTAVNPPLVTLPGLSGLRLGTVAEFPDGMGIVSAIGDRLTTVQYLGGEPVGTDTPITFTNRPLTFPFHSEQIIGRTLNAYGQPIDGKPAMVGTSLPVYGEVRNATRRADAQGFVQTGIPALDVKEPIPLGIKILWMKRPEQSLDYMVARTMQRSGFRRQPGEPVKPLTVVLCMIGMQNNSKLYFDSIRSGVHRSVYIVHRASDPALGALLAPHTACQVGEALAKAGHEVLLMLYDMGSFYNAAAEVNGVQGLPPGKDASPVDFYTQAARIYERAFMDEAAGSLTIIGVMSVPDLDHSDAGANLTEYITEGHIPFDGGRLKFLEALSRLAGDACDATREDHKVVRKILVAAYARVLQVRQQEKLGIETVDKLDLAHLAFAEDFERLVLNERAYVDIDAALDRCWEALGQLPRSAFDVSPEVLERYHTFRGDPSLQT